MYAKARQRGGAVSWFRHLTNQKDNDHVRVAEMRGVAATDLRSAFEEIQATASRKCTKPFFIMEICPAGGHVLPRPRLAVDEEGREGWVSGLLPEQLPDEEYMMKDVYEACERMEKAFPQLAENARIIVEHEKEGRVHWHVTWSRIMDDGRAVNFKIPPALAAAKISYEMNEARGTPQPQGLLDVLDRNTKTKAPTMAETKQAGKVGMDAVQIKERLKRAWEWGNGDRGDIQSEMAAQGFFIARGDKRGFVAVHLTGEVFSLSRCLDAKAATLKAVLGDSAEWPSVDSVKAEIAARMEAKKDNHALKIESRQQDVLEAMLGATVNGVMSSQLDNLRSEQRQERAQAEALPDDVQDDLRMTQRRRLRGLSGRVAAWRKAIEQQRLQRWAQTAQIVFNPRTWLDAGRGLVSRVFWAVGRVPDTIAAQLRKAVPAPMVAASPAYVDDFDPATYQSAADEIAPVTPKKTVDASGRTNPHAPPAKPLKPLHMQKPRL